MRAATREPSRKVRHVRQTLVLLLICTASFMNVLDVTVVSVALPDMGAALGASLSELQWVVNAYTLPLGTLLMSAATLSGSVGRLRLFRWESPCSRPAPWSARWRRRSMSWTGAASSRASVARSSWASVSP